MQIITLALIFGVVMFLVIALITRMGNAPVAEATTLSYVALAFFLGASGASFVAPNLIREAMVKRLVHSSQPATVAQLAAVYQTALIVGLALLEGAGMFGIVVYLVEGHIWTLALPAIAMCLMAIRLPTESRLLDWLDRVERRIREHRV
jgi:hypothetical protein